MMKFKLGEKVRVYNELNGKVLDIDMSCPEYPYEVEFEFEGRKCVEAFEEKNLQKVN
ncbi:hypothetical protein [Liquorilactobacillus mali]|uniref:hypothetical protein n=1 Tax=Liquorilactobacillus mali TaxID=1618 RepID=UPI002350DA8F|nr:hypothetical protein [Liquorilactobacillus mali]MDC7953587.1 hypothetical protein [Liquorilactobacillus mali]MDN7145282.1 hypothetical protein [Liquorilactobacillus mali]